MKVSESRRTPYNDNYGTCERTCAKLLIYPGNCDLAEVTRCLQIEPTETSAPKVGTKRVSGWFLSSESAILSKDLRRHLDWLLSILEGAKEELLALQQRPNVKMAVSCVWWSAYGHGGPALWPEQMAQLAELNLECAFDLYFLGSE